MEIRNITAVTKVTGSGQMVVAAVLEYQDMVSETALPREDAADRYLVKDRTITRAYISRSGEMEDETSEGKYVILELDPQDRGASVKRRIGKGRDAKLRIVPGEVEVRLPGEDFYRKNNQTINQTADLFAQFTYQDAATGKELVYNLFCPQEMEEGKNYPLVLFMHDAGACSADITAPLAQGNGATVWAERRAQKRHACFVLAPRYPEMAANDEFEVTWEADATIRLVQTLLQEYPIDEKRIYGTGQSMGCMMLCELLLRNPGFFAGCYLVAGQWNPARMGAVKDENLWILVSEMDEKAFPIMGDCMKQVEKQGGRVVRGALNAKESLAEQNAVVRQIARTGEHIFFTWYEKDSVLPEGGEIFPGAYHVNTWVHAYYLEAVQDWLFAQSRNRIDFSCKHEVLLEDEEGNRLPMDVPYYHTELIAPGTWQIDSDGDYFYLVEGENEALVIDGGYGCGNTRAFCQSLTEKPVRRIANTHDHFDHTANNCYFDCVYMSQETQPLATVPFPSFSGIDFPRDYAVEIIDEGYVFDLGGRKVETFKCPDHAVGSLMFLDRKEGILFCGDELCMPFGKALNGSVEHVWKMLGKLEERMDEIRVLYGGPGRGETEIIRRLRENMRYILDGHEGKPLESHENVEESKPEEQIVYARRMPHAPDRHKDDPADIPFMREMDYADIKVIYDVRKVWEVV
ncbi:MAG: MBL fold metallo-hydrolase [Eubacterium sp.]|nr:MBL fold metallo-hydrolase [Eubacterium sp.]